MTSIQNRASSTLLAVFTLFVLSCDSNNDGPTVIPGTFQIGVSPQSINIAQGSASYITTTLVRSGGFSGVVSLTISGSPNGVSATMDPAQLSGTTTVSRIDLTVAPTAALGTTTVTMTGSSGDKQSVATFNLIISPPSTYTLSLTPAALTIAAGTSTSATVNIERSNFTGVVALELLDAPSGVVWGFSPTPAGLNTSALDIAVGANVAPGNYPIRIRGSGPGVPERFALFQLTVTPQPSGGVGLDYSFCDPVNAPAYFAYQDGTGAWQRVTPVTAGGVVRFPFNLTSNVGGVMLVYRISLGIDFRTPHRYASGARAHARGVPSNNRPRGAMTNIAAPLTELFVTEVMYATKAEFIQEAAQSCARSFPTKTVSGTVVGVPAGQYGIVALGGSGTIFDGATSKNPVVFSGVQSGLVDFFGTRTTPGQAPNRAVMFRNLNPANNGGSLPQPIDFNGPASFQPAAATVTITGGQGHTFEVYTGVITATSNVGFWNDIAPTTNATRPWAGLDAANTLPGDFHSITVFASPPNEPNNFRVTVKYVGPVSNQSVAFGPIVNGATTSLVSGGAYPRYRFQGALPAEYNKAVGFFIAPEDEGNEYSAYATSAYLAATGSASAYDVTMPDVSGLTGFPTASRLTSGTNGVSTDAYGFTGAGVFELITALGSEFRGSVRWTTIVVP